MQRRHVATALMPVERDPPRRQQLAELDDCDPRIVLVDGQARQDRGADAGADERLRGRVRVRPHGDLRLVPGRAQVALDERHHRPADERDERLGDEVGELRAGAGRCQRRLARDDQHARVDEHLGALQRLGSDRQLAEGGVELAPLDALDVRAIAARLLQLDLDGRMLDGELQQRRGHQPGRGALVDADAQRLGAVGGERAQVGLGGVELPEDAAGVLEQQQAGLGQLDRRRVASDAVDEPCPDQHLELRDLLADGRLHVAEPIGGAPERALRVNRGERREMTKFNPCPALHGASLAERTMPFKRRYPANFCPELIESVVRLLRVASNWVERGFRATAQLIVETVHARRPARPPARRTRSRARGDRSCAGRLRRPASGRG